MQGTHSIQIIKYDEIYAVGVEESLMCCLAILTQCTMQCDDGQAYLPWRVKRFV